MLLALKVWRSLHLRSFCSSPKLAYITGPMAPPLPSYYSYSPSLEMARPIPTLPSFIPKPLYLSSYRLYIRFVAAEVHLFPH